MSHLAQVHPESVDLGEHKRCETELARVMAIQFMDWYGAQFERLTVVLVS